METREGLNYVQRVIEKGLTFKSIVEVYFNLSLEELILEIKQNGEKINQIYDKYNKMNAYDQRNNINMLKTYNILFWMNENICWLYSLKKSFEEQQQQEELEKRLADQMLHELNINIYDTEPVQNGRHQKYQRNIRYIGSVAPIKNNPSLYRAKIRQRERRTKAN